MPLISLVAGTISFVAGETAKHGDMKIDTPVATMGIRGTAVLVEIDFSAASGGSPDAKFQVLVEPDGTTGSYILYDKTTLAQLAVVNQAGQQINISQGSISITNTPLSADIAINLTSPDPYIWPTYRLFSSAFLFCIASIAERFASWRE